MLRQASLLSQLGLFNRRMFVRPGQGPTTVSSVGWSGRTGSSRVGLQIVNKRNLVGQALLSDNLKGLVALRTCELL
jgi:hypothetical protein